ncbi:MAG: NIPSNAP family containing protein [Pleurocapsa sp. SU_196_0]|nr:NIPSNAP family containing protein [Pleurocapsa sp. SU_196_0]
MKLQLRRYTIHDGELENFVAEWKVLLVPLREKLGFTVLQAYTVPDANQFVWLMGYDGVGSWEIADRAYFESPERKTMTPDPARLIARMENQFVGRVR